MYEKGAWVWCGILEAYKSQDGPRVPHLTGRTLVADGTRYECDEPIGFALPFHGERCPMQVYDH